MKIVVDGMGGDNAPLEIVKGTVEASALTEHRIILVGDETRINSELEKYKYDKEKITVVHASEVISNDDAPVKAVRTKLDSSMVKGINMVKSGEADLFVSAGNTGAIMAAGLFILGRIQGIDRPAIASTYPAPGQGRRFAARGFGCQLGMQTQQSAGVCNNGQHLYGKGPERQ